MRDQPDAVSRQAQPCKQWAADLLLTTICDRERSRQAPFAIYLHLRCRRDEVDAGDDPSPEV